MLFIAGRQASLQFTELSTHLLDACCSPARLWLWQLRLELVDESLTAPKGCLASPRVAANLQVRGVVEEAGPLLLGWEQKFLKQVVLKQAEMVARNIWCLVSHSVSMKPGNQLSASRPVSTQHHNQIAGLWCLDISQRATCQGSECRMPQAQDSPPQNLGGACWCAVYMAVQWCSFGKWLATTFDRRQFREGRILRRQFRDDKIPLNGNHLHSALYGSLLSATLLCSLETVTEKADLERKLWPKKHKKPEAVCAD